jgi:hypothetical protein
MPQKFECISHQSPSIPFKLLPGSSLPTFSLSTTMSRYAEAHSNPAGPGDARPTARQIIEDEAVEGKLSEKVIVVIGTSSGIGIETARALS